MEKKDINIVNVNKSFDGVQILKDINLKIEQGEFFSIIGPSGCGKTTLLRMIAGFISPDSGAIYLGDENIVDLPPNLRNVNTIFQKYALFPHLNVFENVAFPLRLKKVEEKIINEEVTKYLKLVGLEEHSTKKVSQLSGGQQQRVSIARAVAKNPKLLLCDEPTGALDYKTGKQVLKILQDMSQYKNSTVIIVTHNSALTPIADKVIYMHDAKISSVEINDNPKDIESIEY